LREHDDGVWQQQHGREAFVFITFNEIIFRPLIFYPELGCMIIRCTSPMIPLFDIWGRQAFGPPLPKKALRGKKFKPWEIVAFGMD
jgi:hypothetical protein